MEVDTEASKKQIEPSVRDKIVARMHLPGANVRIAGEGQEKNIFMIDIRSGRETRHSFPESIEDYVRYKEETGENFVLRSNLVVSPERVRRLVRLSRGNEENKAHELWARQAICFGLDSASLWFMGRDQQDPQHPERKIVMPLFLYHQIDLTRPANCGIIGNRMEVTGVKPGGTSLTVKYSQFQLLPELDQIESYDHPLEELVLGRGEDKVVFDRYDQSRATTGPRFSSSKEINGFYDNVARTGQPDLEGYRSHFPARLITLEELTAFSEVLGDYSNGHLIEGFMGGSRFLFPNRITLGMALFVIAGRELIDATGGTIDQARINFLVPHVPGVAYSGNFFKEGSDDRQNFRIVDPYRHIEFANGFFHLMFEKATRS